ncbi:hypothetical protein KPL76_07140 [Subtercola sp. PAMC28395]|uniref:hypothetical protein n=1 Tax=Subtercola sp. PAMC28395 TaxID=2846775 RepID=UPI001C0AF104|nr:hypothetical protein [Subtercola sp. PAMC28395]QWT25111.1 hypothetical protein KPL76_07140 [Subtercola sp. PAMC28395]
MTHPIWWKSALFTSSHVANAIVESAQISANVFDISLAVEIKCRRQLWSEVVRATDELREMGVPVQSLVQVLDHLTVDERHARRDKATGCLISPHDAAESTNSKRSAVAAQQRDKFAAARRHKHAANAVLADLIYNPTTRRYGELRIPAPARVD